ncbi:MAG: OmpA family protein [Balneolaceae bacterium]
MDKLLRLILIFMCLFFAVDRQVYAIDFSQYESGNCDPEKDIDCYTFTNNFFFEYPQETSPLSKHLFSTPGLQIGGILGQTPLRSDAVNYSIRAYTRHGIGQYLFGEASIGFGVVSGRNYKSRLMPIEYRLNYQLAGLGMSDFKLFNQTAFPYLYIGGGALYHMPVSVPSPQDPLTTEMGELLPTSSLWNFDRGISAVVPAGIGVDIRLDPSTVFNVQLGYNQSIAISDNSFRNGYWGISIGLNFARSNTKARTQPRPVKTFTRTTAPATAMKSPKPPVVFLDDIDKRFIRFDVLSAEIKPEDQSFVEYTASVMQLHENLTLQISGHADKTGADSVNEMISVSRALTVYLALIDQGISPERLHYTAYSNQRPLSTSEDAENEKHKDRRVDFRTNRSDIQTIKQQGENEIYVPAYLSEFEYNVPLFPPRELAFAGNSLSPDDFSEMQILLTSYLMHSRPEMKLIVLSKPEIGPGPELRKALGHARPNVIRAKLVELGIDPQRIRTADEGSELYQNYNDLLEGELQMNLLIPVEEF